MINNQLKMAFTEFIVKIARGEILQQKFKQDVLDGIAQYEKVVDEYKSKAFDIKEQLNSSAISKKARDIILYETLLKQGYLHEIDKYSRDFFYNIPGATVRAKVIDKHEEGEPEDFYERTVYTYKISVNILWKE